MSRLARQLARFRALSGPDRRALLWRVSESLAVDFSDQAGTRQILPGACRIVEQGDSAAHARVAAVERSLVHGVAVRVDGRLYDTDLSPLTPESQNKRER
jgi:hypothetical protein